MERFGPELVDLVTRVRRARHYLTGALQTLVDHVELEAQAGRAVVDEDAPTIAADNVVFLRGERDRMVEADGSVKPEPLPRDERGALVNKRRSAPPPTPPAAPPAPPRSSSNAGERSQAQNALNFSQARNAVSALRSPPSSR